MYLVIVDYDKKNRVTKYGSHKIKEDAEVHLASVIEKFPKAFIVEDLGVGIDSLLVDPSSNTISHSPIIETEAQKRNKIQGEKDLLRMKEAILNMTQNWAFIENSMASLLNSIISVSNFQFGLAIYFAVSSAEARFNIVDKVIIELLEKYENTRDLISKKDCQRLVEIWKKIYSLLKRVKENRNSITHGNIQSITRGEHKKVHVRLTPLMFRLDMLNQMGGGQLPGMSIKDIEETNRIMHGISYALMRLNMSITYIYAREKDSLLDSIHEIESHLKNLSAPQKNSRKS
jgi:hypothetical protein